MKMFLAGENGSAIEKRLKSTVLENALYLKKRTKLPVTLQRLRNALGVPCTLI